MSQLVKAPPGLNAGPRRMTDEECERGLKALALLQEFHARLKERTGMDGLPDEWIEEALRDEDDRE